MKKISPFVLLVLLNASCADKQDRTTLSTNSDPSSNDRLADDVTQYIKDNEPQAETGIAIAVIRNDELVLQKAYGLRDRENKLPATLSTMFAIGSTSKAFTGIAAALLADRGLLNLDKPLNDFTSEAVFPEFQLNDPEWTKRVTITDLLSHRSGLPRHDALWYMTRFNSKELIKRIQCLKSAPFPNEPLKSFRHVLQYNNIGYLAAGTLIGNLSGQGWKGFVENNIFKPLHMSESTASFFTGIQKENSARGYRYEQRLSVPDGYLSVSPAGSIVSDISDMTKWLRFHLDEGLTEEGDELLQDKSYLERTYRSYIRVGVGGYGYGWVVQKTATGDLVITHSGGLDGYTAVITAIPSTKTGVVVLTNQHGAVDFAYGLSGVALGLTTGPTTDGDAAASNPSTFEIDNHVQSATRQSNAPVSGIKLGEYLGAYEHCAYGRIQITTDHDNLVADFHQNRFRLEPQSLSDSQHSFLAHITIAGHETPVPFYFQFDDGRVTSAVAYFSEIPVVFKQTERL